MLQLKDVWFQGMCHVAPHLEKVHLLRQLSVLHRQDPCGDVGVPSNEFGARGHADVSAQSQWLLKDRRKDAVVHHHKGPRLQEQEQVSEVKFGSGAPQ